MSGVTTTIRKSGRLASKATVPYKEKKIPKLSKARVSKRVVVQKGQTVSTATKISEKQGKIEKIKVEKIKVEKKTKIPEFSNAPSASYVLSDGNHLEDAIEHFKKYDPKLASYLNEDTIANFRKRIARKRGVDPFRTLAGGIIYQQIHGKAAASIEARFIKLFDTTDATKTKENWYPSPDDVLSKSIDELKGAGLSTRKAEYIQCLAQKFNDKTITPENFVNMTDQEIGEQLTQVKGIGQWTVDMFLMQELRHSDIMPLGDLGVRKGVAQHFNLTMPSDKKKVFPLPHHMVELTDIWRPYRTLGSWLMWRLLDIKVTGDVTEEEGV